MAASFLPNLATWPFAPGESPFAIKGTAYRSHIEFVEGKVPGGMQAMGERLPDERYAAFFRRSFLAATFYDLMPLIVAAAPCATLMSLSPADFVALRSRDQAPKDLGGVYRFVLAMVPTGTVARRLPQLLTQVLNFGSTSITRSAPGEFSAVLDGVPEAYAPWLSTVMRAYGETALRVSGAKHASFLVKPGEASGMARGVRILRCGVEVQYG